MDKDADTMVATATVTSDDRGPEKLLSVYVLRIDDVISASKPKDMPKPSGSPGGGSGDGMGGDMTYNKMLDSSFLFWQGDMKIGEASRNGF